MRYFVLLLVAFVAACSSTPTTDPKVAEFFQWRDQTRQSAIDGKVAWTDYYVQYYDRMAAMPPDQHKTIEMQAIAELIPAARRYEAGEITKDQFYDIRRLTGARYQAIHENARAMQQAQLDALLAKQQAENAEMWKQIGQSFAPKPTVNCTTTRFPGSYTATTSCR